MQFLDGRPARDERTVVRGLLVFVGVAGRGSIGGVGWGRGVLAVAGGVVLAAVVASVVVVPLVWDLPMAANVGQLVGVVLGVPAAGVGLWRWSRTPGGVPRGEGVDLAVVREGVAADRLAEFLGRNTALPFLGDKQAGPLALGVHPPIDTPDAARLGLDPEVPVFVEREVAGTVRGWLEQACRDGGFVLLVGTSSVGKTRLLYETACRVLPGFRVLAPGPDGAEVVSALARATVELPPLIVWLDELQRFLDGPYLTPGTAPLTHATVRRLLDAPTSVVILGTLWPDRAEELRAITPDPGTGQPRPRHPGAHEILTDRRRHELVVGTFTRGERTTAAELAGRDPRLAVAVADQTYNVTEALAGAPHLIPRYDQAPETHRAILDAAIDARRVGVQSPLTDELLTAAARGYLHTTHPDDTWYPPAIAALTAAPYATAPLIPVPTTDRRHTTGYTLADYLLQYGTRQHHTRRLPHHTWNALTDHTTNPEDLHRLTQAATNRLLLHHAEPLLRRLADTSDPDAAFQLAELLIRQGRTAEAIAVLPQHGDTGHPRAARELAELLVEQGRVDELRVRADTGDPRAAEWLAGLLAAQGRVDELRVRADAGDPMAGYLLAGLLVEQGRVDELRVRAETGDPSAGERLAKLLAQQGRVDEAIAVLQPHAETGDSSAGERLAKLLAQQGRVDEAIAVLQPHADAGDPRAARQLAGLLIEQGRVDELRVRADAGDPSAGERLAKLLAAQGRVDEAIAVLQPHADIGHPVPARQLADLLAARANLEGVQRYGLSCDGGLAEEYFRTE